MADQAAVPVTTQQDVFSILQMLQKMLKYAVQTGIVMAGADQVTNANLAIEWIMGSAAAMGVLVGLINFIKVKIGKKLPVQFKKQLKK